MAENKDEGPTCSVPKKRKPNWTTDECLYLSKLVDENKSVLRSKFGAGVTTVKKRETWGKITDAINATSSTKRSVEEVEKKWHNIQMRGKAEIADARRSAKKTGGGPAGKPLTPLAEAVESVIGTDNISISGIPGAVDTTFLMLDNEHNTANIATRTVEQRPSAVVQDLQILSTNESGDGQINLVTLPARKCNTCSCSIDSCMGDLQKRKLELEIENFTLRNTLVKLQIERLQNDSE
uniref:Myb-like domain-containing protein n=1 Tax=Magallana gigas TaxID=29159 RepID=A0A8W8IDY6_MAGGI